MGIVVFSRIVWAWSFFLLFVSSFSFADAGFRPVDESARFSWASTASQSIYQIATLSDPDGFIRTYSLEETQTYLSDKCQLELVNSKIQKENCLFMEMCLADGGFKADKVIAEAQSLILKGGLSGLL